MVTWIDLETIGLLSRYDQPRINVGVSELALYSTEKGYTGAFTDILSSALGEYERRGSTKEYHAQLIAKGWDPGFGRPDDVLAGVHARQVAATHRAWAGGKPLIGEKEVLRRVGKILASGESIGAWNVEFDMGTLQEMARRVGDTGFIRQLTRAHASGRIVEGAEPVRRLLFNLAREGAIDLGFTAGTAKALAARPGATAEQIAALSLGEMIEPHMGFRRLFEMHPGITYEAYKQKLATGGLEEMLGVQEFSAGLRRPAFRYVKGWRQSTIAEAICPGFLDNPTSTQLGQQIAKRLNLSQGEKITAHLARDDSVLTGILNELLSSKDPWAALQGYGGLSKGRFITQYKSALERDVRITLGTYLGEGAKDAMDNAYLRKVLSGAEEMGVRAPDVARASGTQIRKWPGLMGIGRGTIEEVKAAVAKHPRASTAAALVGTVLLADAFIPEDNKLEGRRQPDSKYTQLGGINFGGIGAPSTYFLTDFGSGRSRDNASTQLRAWKLARSKRPPTWRGYSVGEIEQAQSIWGGAKSQRGKRQFSKEDYVVRGAQGMSIPGVRSNAWLGTVDLRDYRVKANDADTINLFRRGLLHIFDKPISVRLAGIDAPETHPQWPFGMQPGGVESGEYLRKLLDHQESLKLLIDPQRTTYGRHIGILSGDVHPNINLKLVSAGAAANLPSYGGIIDAQAYTKAEAIAAASGLGMWSSKGWQAKRMLDLSVSDHVTNTSLMNMNRLAGEMELMEYSDLVQAMHESPKEKPWEEGELDALAEVMAVRKKERLWHANTEIKRHGWVRGIRQPDSPWAIVTPGIAPSNLQGANVSAFGSGRSTEAAEGIVRAIDPLRRRFIPRVEPIMVASPAKAVGRSYLSALKDKIVASGQIGTTQASAKFTRRVPREVVRSTIAPALKPTVLDRLPAAAAGTAVSLTGPKIIHARREAFIGHLYSAQAAVGVPWKSLNEYQAIRGPGFPGNWKIQAWSSLIGAAPYTMGHAGILGENALERYGITKETYRKFYQTLKGRGFTPRAVVKILRDHGLFKAMKIARKAIEKEAGLPGKPGFWAGLFKGQMPNRWAQNFVAGQPKTWAELVAFTKERLSLQKSLWQSTVSKEAGLLGKTGGLLDFLAHVDAPLSLEMPSSLEAPARKAIQKKLVGSWAHRARRRLIGERAPSADLKRATDAIASQTSKVVGLNRLAGGARRLTSKAVGKLGGPINAVIFGSIYAIGASAEYKNRAMGLGVEFAADSANFATWALTTAAVKPYVMGGGAWLGGVVGGVIGSALPIVGTTLGALAGKVIGTALGWVVSHAIGMAAGAIVGEGVRAAGQTIASKRNPEPHMPDGQFYGPQIPGMSLYGGTDQYLTAGHGMTPSAYSGFGGGLKPIRESKVLAETLGRANERIVGSAPKEQPIRLARTKSRLLPTAGLTNIVLWQNRRRITRGRSSWPVQWEKRHKVTAPVNSSRMMRSAA